MQVKYNHQLSVGNRLKECRRASGMTQKEMASILGIKQSTYSNYENGIRNPSKELLEKIAAELNVDVNELIENDDSVVDFSGFEQYLQTFVDSFRNDFVKKFENEYGMLLSLYSQLSDVGQGKALEQLELLTRIPEYRREQSAPPDAPDQSDLAE